MSKTFLRFIEECKWQEACELLPTVKASKPIADTLKKLLHKHDVPSEVLRSLLVRLKELSKTKIFPTSLTSLMRLASNKELKDFCREGSLSMLKTFLQEVSGTYQESSGREFTWPSSEVVRELIHSIWDNYLRDPISVDWKHVSTYPAKTESLKDLKQASSLALLEQYPSLKLLWQETEALLLAYTQRDQFQPLNAGNDWLVVHAIAEANCSAIIMWFALRLYPEQVRTRDHRGNLPLHYSTAYPPSSGYPWLPSIDYKNTKMNEADGKPLITFLLDTFPEGAGYTGEGGRLPLHCFLEINELGYMHEYRHVISALIKAYPEALAKMDPKTRLYPFALVASFKINSFND